MMRFTMKLNLWDSHINPSPPIARASNKSCEIYDKNHQAYKNATEVVSPAPTFPSCKKAHREEGGEVVLPAQGCVGQPGCKTSNAPTTFLTCSSLVACASGVLQRCPTRWTKQTQMQLENVFLPSGSLQSLAYSFQNYFQEKVSFGGGMRALVICFF